MRPEPGCPKAMRYGPCGGAQADGRCEVGDRACPFVAPGRGWSPPGPAAAQAPTPAFTAPRVVVDVREPVGFIGDPRRLWRDTAAVLAGATALIGEHADRIEDDAGRLPVPRVVRLLAAGGAGVLATVTGRDRTSEGLRRDVAALGHAAVLAIHCVTGDHPGALGIDRSPRWGAESFDIVAAAVAAGVTASVAESPASPGPRVERVLAKERAGASMVILNHGGDPADLVAFARRCRDHGVSVPMLAPVPIVVDPTSAARLDRFPGLRLPTGLIAAVATSRAPRREGIARGVALAAELLDTGEFAGVNLSGPAGIATAEARLAITADVLDALSI